MATELIGGALVSGAIQLLLERIISLAENYFLKEKDSDLEGLLKRLRTMMSSLTGVLDDAEERQIRNDPRVESWLDDLQEALFDADDLLDDIETDALQLKAEGDSSSAGTSEVRDNKKLKISNFISFSRGSNERDMERKIKALLERLEEITKQKDRLGLREITSPRWQRLPSTSLVEESEVFGRDDDKEDVIKLLMSDDAKLCVIPIVGMAGIGKTTLIQAVFNHDDVREKFQLKEWVCVSEEYDVLRVTKTILYSGSQIPCGDDMDLNSLQVKLKERLSGKKFLIVLDNVWSEKYDDWEAMRMPFMDGAQGSKILVTTRSLEVASVMGTPNIPAHRLNVLTEEASWQLFEKHAFSNFAMNPDLERIGKEIVKKCNGLPLAIKTLGGLLRSTSDIYHWERVLTSDIWELTDNAILPSLRLSYYYLPSHLKRCFAYCSLFPKGSFEFGKDELIALWMAENLLERPKGNMSIDEVGNQYFNHLLSRSFFQSRIDEKTYATRFFMHDLIVDLANSISGKYHYRLHSRNSEVFNVKKETRYLVCQGHDIDWQRFNSINFEATQLRTFVHLKLVGPNDDLFLKLVNLRVLSLCGNGRCNEFIHSICKLRHLRLLDLPCASINNLPNSFCNLYNLQSLRLANCHFLSNLPNDFHRLSKLRYLDASNSGLEALPESFSRLVDLQMLKLSGCYNLTKLPDGFHDLINLRYLDIEGTGLKAMPTQICKLKNLRNLSTFIVGKEVGSKISDLGIISKLSGMLNIKNLQNVVKAEDALEAKLREKYLEVLSFEWAYHHITNDLELEMKLLDNLSPNTSLISLNIIRYGGDRFPNWVGHWPFSNIVYVFLCDCYNCVTLPPLGQLSSLKKLSIRGFEAVVNVGVEFYGTTSSMVIPFASLEELKFSWMRKWKAWIIPNQDVKAFPKLRELSLQHCDSLTGDMLSFLPSLRKLTLDECQQLASPVPRMPKATILTLAKALESNSNLQNLCITADSLSLQFECLPSALKKLSIKCFESLEFQLQHKSHDSLKKLSLQCYNDFGRLSFALDCFPNISSVRLHGWENLGSLWVSSNGLSIESPKSLTSLSISNCPGLTLLWSKLSNLTYLEVSDCNYLKFLPEQMHNLLPSLQSLGIIHCSELESFPVIGLPSSLRNLAIEKCDKLVASWRNWNLQKLPNLTFFMISEIECEDMESFPGEGLLPSTVSTLYIQSIGGLKCLDNKGLQQLTSLKHLSISYCLKLEMMTEEGLPKTLSFLSITRCPLLEDKCEKDTGEYWNKISHIVHVRINGKKHV